MVQGLGFRVESLGFKGRFAGALVYGVASFCVKDV